MLEGENVGFDQTMCVQTCTSSQVWALFKGTLSSNTGTKV